MTDHLGSTVGITDTEGNVLWQDELTPFGESTGSFGHEHNLAKFTGKDLDIDINLYYFNARWYDPDTGRFISTDPVKDGLNWYVYCSNNPINFIDLSGLDPNYADAGVDSDEYYDYDYDPDIWINWLSDIDKRNDTAAAARNAAYQELIESSQGAFANDFYAYLEGNKDILAEKYGEEGAEFQALYEETAYYDFLSTATPEINKWVKDAVRNGEQLTLSDIYKQAEILARDKPGKDTLVLGIALGLSAGLNAVENIASRYSIASALDDVAGTINNIDDIFSNPQALKNMSPEQVKILAQQEGWEIGTLGKGSQQGNGLIIRQLNEYGNPTDKMIQWHPGGGHHGVQPYWKVSSGTTGTVRIGPQF